jgi:phytoene dehydrogenase-like protein
LPPRVAIVGAGHNGLVCAAYLARAGAQVRVLERRERVGGACVTEERWPGYRVSRAAYVVSLLRPRIARELELSRHGLELVPRVPASFTPLPDGRSLVLGAGAREDAAEIARFSCADALAYPGYEAWLARVAAALDPLLDEPPPELPLRPGRLRPWWRAGRAALALGRELPRSVQLLLGPARAVLEELFESEPLRSTLATDALIGAFAGPSTPGTGYVLFHHVMGESGGRRGVWAYVRGGMGRLADALASAARAAGARIETGSPVASIRTRAGRACGVVLESGEEVPADAVISNADPLHTLRAIDSPDVVPEPARRALLALDVRSPVVKLNLALGELPRFALRDRERAPLGGTIHLGPTDLDGLERAFADAAAGRVSDLPMVELTIPSVLDETLAPAGRHVASIFAQYAPALEMRDARWPELRDAMAKRALGAVEALAPGFERSIEHLEVLAPPDLEREFGLAGGHIFHGAMTPDRLLFGRPAPGWTGYRTPLAGLYLCGAGTHPGGGVMGACGRNAARIVWRDLRARVPWSARLPSVRCRG